ncbi:MAG: asparagine synthase (glutamine-hydrolyzing) [Epsilonproteobacteria bacterium]|nr:asparagine synthase (glutamine-hydrolyzing) [Campylobacterota bacterium]
MCGYTGYANLSRSTFRVEQELLDNMQQCIAHRGPDQYGFWSHSDHEVALASRRLKIIDLSEAGRQPMVNEYEQIVVAFNGEIYNYQELRQELQALGCFFASQTDTEVIIHAYKQWGIDKALERFDGMFSIALYDMAKRELFLIRDRIGVKPLYFSQQGGYLSFASEIKALWVLPWMKKAMSSRAVYHYLTFMVAPAPVTIFQGVYKLPAGYYLKLDANKKVSFTQWYCPIEKISRAERKQFYSQDFCVEGIRSLLVKAVQKRMVADVPVGAFLSGGIDSSLNVALMSRFSSNVKTYTVRFLSSQGYDEGAWARLVAREFGTEHHEIAIAEREAYDFYQQMVYQLDEPLADCVCIPFYFVSKLARDDGAIVVQVGEGADELFFGYPTYNRYRSIHNWFWVPTSHLVPHGIRKVLWSLMRHFLPEKNRWTELFHKWSHHRPLFWGGAIGFPELAKRRLYAEHVVNKFDEAEDSVVEQIYPGLVQNYDSFSFVEYHLAKLEELWPEADFGQQMLYLELKQRLPELLLMRADKMSMAASIEARVPFLDHKLVEFMMHVPLELRCRNGTTKYLLKKAAEGLIPQEIIQRKKVGFGAPTHDWLDQGKHFPAYFAQGARRANGQKNIMPARACNKISQVSRLTVQQWILHQLQTFEQLQ